MIVGAKPEKWISAYQAMKDNLSLDNDDLLGVFAASLRFNIDDIHSTASEAITGSGDDKKCDVIILDKERKTAIVAQCYMSQKTRKSAPSNKASDLNTGMTWLLSTDLQDVPDAIRGHADELRVSIQDGEIDQIHIWYVHNCPGSKNVEDELAAVERTTKALLKTYVDDQPVSIHAEEISSEKIEEFYKQAEQTIIVTESFNLKPFDAIELEGHEWSSVVTVVDGAWLHDVYSRYGKDLFSANLRGYLGSRSTDSNIYNGIKKTVVEEPDNFSVYNNGITALVLDYELDKRTRGGRKLRIDGISIVNGAQTTGSIGSTESIAPNTLRVPVRFVKAKKSSIVSNVVRFNNSQNKLQAADFRSNDQIQERLRKEFDSIPAAEYEGGRRGGASDAIKRSKYALPSYPVAQALKAFHGDAISAYNEKSELWTNESLYRGIFTDRTTARHIVFCYSLLQCVNQLKADLAKRRKVDASSMTEADNSKLEFLTKKGANYLIILSASKCIETIMGKPITNRFDLKFSKNESPADLSDFWSPIVDLFLSFSGQMDQCFSNNRISRENIESHHPVFVSIISSLAVTHAATFEAFRNEVSA